MQNIVLETKRLILKRISPSEIEDIFSLRSDPEVMKYIDDGSIWTKEKVEDWIQVGAGSGYYEKYGLDFFLYLKKKQGNLLGKQDCFTCVLMLHHPTLS